jgi:hypothetical protein
MWIPFNKTSVRIAKSIIVLWTLFNETSVGMVMSRRVWRYQRGNQNPYNNSHRGFAERYPQDNNIYNNFHRGFVEQCPDHNNRYNNSHGRYRNDVQVTCVHPRFLVRFVIYIIVMWIPFNKTSGRIVKSIIVLWTLFHETSVGMVISRRVWRYQRGNQNPYIKEDQTIQWPKGKVQKTVSTWQ